MKHFIKFFLSFVFYFLHSTTFLYNNIELNNLPGTNFPWEKLEEKRMIVKHRLNTRQYSANLYMLCMVFGLGFAKIDEAVGILSVEIIKSDNKRLQYLIE